MTRSFSLLALLIATTSFAQKQPDLKKLDAYIANAMTQLDQPGLAVGKMWAIAAQAEPETGFLGLLGSDAAFMDEVLAAFGLLGLAHIRANGRP